MKYSLLVGALAFLTSCQPKETQTPADVEPHQQPAAEDVAEKAEAEPAKSATPPVPPKQKHAAWMVIVGGSTVEADAKTMLAEVTSAQLPGAAVLIDSSTIEGLKPGFFIISVGIIKDQGAAERVRKHFNRFRKGTYIRQVQVKESEDLTCPAPRCPGPWRAVVIHSVAENPGEDWGWFTNDVQEALGEHDILFPHEPSGTTTVRIERGGHLLGTVDTSRYRTNGYILVSDSSPPTFVAHAMPGEIISEADAYFDLGLVVH